MKDDLVYLEHILLAIIAIEKYLLGKTFADLETEHIIQDSVIRNLEIIGEASNNLSEKFRLDHPEIDWRQAIGMRNRLVHDYFGVDLDTVWRTVQEDLPPLKFFAQKIVGGKR